MSDREALVALLAGYGVWLDRASDIADAVLRSSWLADRDRVIEAEILRTIADQWTTTFGPTSDPADVARWLYSTAATLEGMTTR